VPVGEHAVRKAEQSEVHALATTLALAFDDDPLTNWLFPKVAARRRKLPAFFRALLRAAIPLGAVYTTVDDRAVAMWNPPGTFPMDWRTDAKVGMTTARLVGPRIVTRARGLLYFQNHHPKDAHWYLQMLGTRPEWQGKGAGSAVIEPVLRHCDETGERVYLESSKESNIPFYARHGFEVTEELHIPDGGPVVFAMWRAPR
jgi:GNAT superfamily N-acetyltransferase